MRAINFLVLLFLMVLIPSIKAQYIDVSDTTGCAPLSDVTFDVNGVLTDVLWDFGDGASSADVNPDHSYGLPGEFTVVLTGNDNGTPITETQLITVYGKPSPNFTVPGSLRGCIPFTVDFEDNSTSGGGIESWEWTFGDGGADSIQDPSYTYILAGTFTVSLIVTDSNGCDSALVMPQYITANVSPDASFTTDPTSLSVCEPPLTVGFTNNSVNGNGGTNNISHLWDMGNGVVSSATNAPDQTYTEIGTFPIKLIVTDNLGCQDSLMRTVNIGNPTADFSIPDSICLGDELNPFNSSLGANGYTWDFGDGQTSTSGNPGYTYPVQGSYDINLIARNTALGCSDDTTITIFVQEVVAEFTSSPIFSCENPMCQTFQQTSSANASQFNWYFEHDFQVDNGENVTHCFYIDTNRYTVHDPYEIVTILTASSSLGCSDTVEHRSTLSPISAFVQPDVYQGCAPLTVNFRDSTRSNEPIVSWFYDFDDGSTSTDRHPTHTFTTPGTYTVTVDVVEQTGCSDDDYTIVIEVGEPIVPSFTVSTNQICRGDEVTFESTTPDADANIDYYHYTSDNDMFSACPQDSSATGAFTQLGFHDVTLTAVYNGCESSSTVSNAVEVLGPKSFLTYSYDCSNPYDYTFEGKMEGADQWTFTIDETVLPMTADVSRAFTFSSSGNYWAYLEAENTGNVCPSHTDSILVAVRDIQANIASEDTTACENVAYNFDASASKDVYTGCYPSYTWISDNVPPVYYTGGPVFTYDPSAVGPNSVRLIVSDVNGCRDTLDHDFIVYETEAIITTDTLTGCMPLTINFTDASTSSATITNWNWELGNGTVTTTQNTSGLYIEEDSITYTARLTITNEFGCSDDAEVVITPIVPSVSVSILSDNSVCENDSIRYRINGTGALASWDWEFGDGETDNSMSSIVYHTFDEAGDFDITINVVDTNGCTRTRIYEDYARLQEYPVSSIQADRDVSGFICYPAAVEFTDLTEFSPADSTFPFRSRVWDLGTGSPVLPNESVSTIYELPGDYTVSLITETTYGCKDTATIDLSIIGPIANFTMDENVICIGDEISVQIVDSSDVTFFAWDFGNGNIISGQEGQASDSYDFVPLNGETIIQLLMWGEDSVCPSVVSQDLAVHEVYANFGSADSLICLETAIAFVDSSVNANSYLWEFGNGQTSSVSSPAAQTYSTEGSYDVSLIIENVAAGCIDTMTRTYIVYGLPEIVANDTAACDGDEARLYVTGADTYSWEPKEYIMDGDSTDSPICGAVNHQTIYTVTGVDTRGCVSTENVTLTMYSQLSIPLIDTCIIIGEELTIGEDYGQGYEYSWLNGDTTYLECTDCAVQTVRPLQDPSYVFTVTDTLGCYISEENYIICVNPEFTVDVPDMFTPNGDGVNDLVTIDGWGIKNLLEFKIYNRWGELVFETTDITQGWDGTYKGELQNVEVFIYTITVEYYENGGTGNKTGNITLMR